MGLTPIVLYLIGWIGLILIPINGLLYFASRRERERITRLRRMYCSTSRD